MDGGIREPQKMCNASNLRFLLRVPKNTGDSDIDSELSHHVEGLLSELVETDAGDDKCVVLCQQLLEIIKTDQLFHIDPAVFLRTGFIQYICEVFQSPGLALESVVREILLHVSYLDDVAESLCTIEFMNLCVQYLGAEANVIRCEEVLTIINHIARRFADKWGVGMLPLETVASTSATNGVLEFVQQVVQTSDDTQGISPKLIEMCMSVMEKLNFSESNVRKLFYIMACIVSHNHSDDCLIFEDCMGYDEPLFFKVFRYFDPDDVQIVQYFMLFASTIFCYSQVGFALLLSRSISIQEIVENLLFPAEDHATIACCLQCIYYYITGRIEEEAPIVCSEALVLRLLEYLHSSESSFNMKNYAFYVLFHISCIEPETIPFLISHGIVEDMEGMLGCALLVTLRMAIHLINELSKANKLDDILTPLAEINFLDQARSIAALQPDEEVTTAITTLETISRNKHV